MANKRMLNASVIKSDSFTDLPFAAQALYIQLNLSADDDGLVGNSKSLMRSLKIPKKNLSLLFEAGFMIELSSSVVAVTHWHVHNNIRGDRYTSTYYPNELARLEILENKSYELIENIDDSDDFGMQNDSQNAPQSRIGYVSEEKEKSIYSNTEKSSEPVALTPVENSEIKENADKITLTYIETLSFSEKEKYRDFLHKVNLYFLNEYNTINSKEFIEYNERRFWHGKDGESVRDKYKQYIDAWVRRDIEFGYR